MIWNDPFEGLEMNWALIGASTIAGQYMVGAIRSYDENKIDWIVSGSAARALAFAQDHTIRQSTTELSDALSDARVSAVYISSTNEMHKGQALPAIAAGKHVLCEKPLAVTPADAAEMVRAAREAGVVFATNHHLRASGSHRAIRALIAGGEIGRVLSLRIFHAVELPEHLRGWRLDNPAAGGGVIPDITVHNADTVRFLLSEDPVSVVAEMAATGLGKGVEDSAMSVWSMPSGAMVFSHESFTHPFAGSGLEVHGTKGSIFAHGVMTQEPVGTVELVTSEGKMAVPYDAANLYETVIANFNALVQGADAPSATGTDGIKSLVIALGVREAARTGQRHILNYGNAA